MYHQALLVAAAAVYRAAAGATVEAGGAATPTELLREKRQGTQMGSRRRKFYHLCDLRDTQNRARHSSTKAMLTLSAVFVKPAAAQRRQSVRTSAKAADAAPADSYFADDSVPVQADCAAAVRA